MVVLDKEAIKSSFLGEPRVEEIIEPIIQTQEYSKFRIGPLERGFGTTIGNSLRRILLFGLLGGAVTYVKIEGILHEFSTIPGVLEDTTDIVINFKKLRLKVDVDHPMIVRIEKSGEQEVLAGDIETPPEVHILNPDLHIATLVDKHAKFNVELGVAKGKGYLPAERQKVNEQLIGLIPVDSIFTPIVKVNYVVEDTRVGQLTEYENLILEVWTDKSISPSEAISEAAKILQKQLSIFIKLTDFGKEEEEESGVPREKSIMDLTVDELDLSVRSYNCLKRAGIMTVGDLVKYSEADIMNVRNFGKKSLDEIKDKLSEYGLALRQE